MMNGQTIFVGWPDIAKACGVSVQVMKRIAKRYEMPYARLCGKVTLPRMTLVEWVAGLCNVVGKGEGMMDDFVLQKLKNLKKIQPKGGITNDRETEEGRGVGNAS